MAESSCCSTWIDLDRIGLGSCNCRQDVFDVHPLRRVIARIAGGAERRGRHTVHRLTRSAGVGQADSERYASESASMNAQISAMLLFAAIRSFLLGVSTP